MPAAARRLIRTRLTWYCYLLSGFFTVVLNIQGNIIPFLREELGLSYRTVALHPAGIAAGMIVAGALTERVVRRLGARRALILAVGGSLSGIALMLLARTAAVSIAGCVAVGLTGAMIPGIIAGVLAQAHGAARDQAYAECGAVTYACVVASGLAVSATVALGLGWRAALLLGALLGVGLIAVFGRDPIAAPPPAPARGQGGGLPAACVVYLVTLGFGVALEYAALLWAPAYFETVVGMDRPAAAAAAATFAAAMLAGRWAGSRIVRNVAPATLYPAALSLAAPGFVLYWVVATPAAAIAGLFLLGLATALLYPLSLGLAIAAAGPAAAAAGARSALAAGSALLLSPLVLGGLADSVGLRAAVLAIPALALAILSGFGMARLLQRRMVPPAVSGESA